MSEHVLIDNGGGIYMVRDLYRIDEETVRALDYRPLASLSAPNEVFVLPDWLGVPGLWHAPLTIYPEL